MRALVAFLFLTSAAFADTQSSHENGVVLCEAVDGTGLTSKPCSVSSWHSAIDVTIDTTSREAKKVCLGLAMQMTAAGLKWDRGWRIRIYSPFSGESSIAFCDLPSS
jgi:hypothetical protein